MGKPYCFTGGKDVTQIVVQRNCSPQTHSKELHNLPSSPGIFRVTITYILFGKPRGKRTLVRSRSRWGDNKTNF